MFLKFAQSSYGAAVCDPDLEGHALMIGSPLCPDGCGSMTDFQPLDEHVEVLPVMHRRWDSASAAEKVAISKCYPKP